MQRTIVRIGLVGAVVLAGISGALSAQAATPAHPATAPAARSVLTSGAHHTALPTRHAAAPDSTNAPVGPRFTSGTEYRVTSETLNVRSGPATSYRVVDSLGVGHMVFVKETKNGWSEIGTNEWVSSDYLALVGRKHVHYVYVPKGHHYRPGGGSSVNGYSIVNKAWAVDFKPGDAIVYVAVQDIPIFNGSASTVGTTIVGHTHVGGHYLGSIGIQPTSSGDYRYLGSGHWVGAEALVPAKHGKHAAKAAHAPAKGKVHAPVHGKKA